MPSRSAAPAGSPPEDHLAIVGGLDVQAATVADLGRAMSEGRLTSARLVQAYLARTQEWDAETNSVRALDPHAPAVAAERDRERAAGHVRGPLHGVPVLLKDNIGTRDLPTTAGSVALEGSVPHEDAVLTARLRAAGAVVLGKTNLSEFANWVSPTLPNGWSSLGGQVRDAYGLGDPSGSSSGSGVAASLALAAATVGSETCGSILSPSSVNGLVGVRPTRGSVSRTGVVPLAEGFDTAGPMTRSVADAAVLLAVMAGSDPSDPATADADRHPPVGLDGAGRLTPASLEGVRLGHSPADEQGLDDAGRALWAQALDDLRALGAVLVPSEAVGALHDVGHAAFGLIPADFRANLDHYLQTRVPVPPSGVRSLADVVAFGARHPDRFPYGQDLLVDSAATTTSRQEAAAAALAVRTASRAAVDQVLAHEDLAAVVGPGPVHAMPGATAGYPAVVVPMGLARGRPLGLSFLGTAWSDWRLLALAAAYERATGRRVPPPVRARAVGGGG